MKADKQLIDLTINDRALWGAKSIGNFVGRSEQFVRRVLLPDPDCPVFKRAGRLFARSDQLNDWLTFKPPEAE